MQTNYSYSRSRPETTLDRIVANKQPELLVNLVRSVVDLTNHLTGTNLTGEYPYRGSRVRDHRLIQFYNASSGRIYKVVLDSSGDLGHPGFSKRKEVQTDAFVRWVGKDIDRRIDVLRHICDYVGNLDVYARQPSEGHEKVAMRVP